MTPHFFDYLLSALGVLLVIGVNVALVIVIDMAMAKRRQR